MHIVAGACIWAHQSCPVLQGSGQGAHDLQNVPGCAFLPAQAMAVAPGQIHSSCSIESLVSGAGGVPEGSYESSATVMASRNMATAPRQQSMQVISVSYRLRCACKCLYQHAMVMQRS